MKYELAKELKAAGFIQEGAGYLEPSRLLFDRKTGEKKGHSESLYFPTLDELLENCGKEVTIYIGKTGVTATKSHRRPIQKGFGTTPKEAVAKLWLALNKKI